MKSDEPTPLKGILAAVLTIALTAAVIAGGIAAFASASPLERGSADCGGVTFRDDASAGLVSAKRVDCRTARRLAVRCGKGGVTPRRWLAREGGGGFQLVDGPRLVSVAIAGGNPPGLRHCLKNKS